MFWDEVGVLEVEEGWVEVESCKRVNVRYYSMLCKRQSHIYPAPYPPY